jgi:dihydrofolate reductase
MIRSLIVALTPQGVIGRAGGLPWRLSADLQRFKRLTMGHAIIMGRKTYESIGRPLPGRKSIVVTRSPDGLRKVLPKEVLVAASVRHAFELASGDSEAFLIGGGELFREALGMCDRAYVTWVDAELDGDTHFPEFPAADWKLESRETLPADEKNEFPTRFCVYHRQGE